MILCFNEIEYIVPFHQVQDLQALRDETCALRGPVPPGKGGTRIDGAKEKKNPSQTIMVQSSSHVHRHRLAGGSPTM